MVNPTNYATDLAKVLFALSKITGDGFATEWVNMKGEEILGSGKAGTWAELVEEMKRVFNDPNDCATALADIARLKQGTMTAPEFFAKFKTLFQRAEMAEVANLDILVHWLELNLSRRLVGKVYGVLPMPETYVEWKALAERLDASNAALMVSLHNRILHTPPCLLPTACSPSQTALPPPHIHSWPPHPCSTHHAASHPSW